MMKSKNNITILLGNVVAGQHYVPPTMVLQIRLTIITLCKRWQVNIRRKVNAWLSKHISFRRCCDYELATLHLNCRNNTSLHLVIVIDSLPGCCCCRLYESSLMKYSFSFEGPLSSSLSLIPVFSSSSSSGAYKSLGDWLSVLASSSIWLAYLDDDLSCRSAAPTWSNEWPSGCRRWFNLRLVRSSSTVDSGLLRCVRVFNTLSAIRSSSPASPARRCALWRCLLSTRRRWTDITRCKPSAVYLASDSSPSSASPSPSAAEAAADSTGTRPSNWPSLEKRCEESCCCRKPTRDDDVAAVDVWKSKIRHRALAVSNHQLIVLLCRAMLRPGEVSRRTRLKMIYHKTSAFLFHT